MFHISTFTNIFAIRMKYKFSDSRVWNLCECYYVLETKHAIHKFWNTKIAIIFYLRA